jgi:hypothetical protein
MAAATSLMFQGLTRIAPGVCVWVGGCGCREEECMWVCGWQIVWGGHQVQQQQRLFQHKLMRVAHACRKAARLAFVQASTMAMGKVAGYRTAALLGVNMAHIMVIPQPLTQPLTLCFPLVCHPPAPKLCAAPANSDSTSTPALSAWQATYS